MKRKKNGLLIFILLIVCDIGLDAQNLYIRNINGTQTAYAPGDIKKISFQPRILEVDLTNNEIETYNLEAVRYLNFVNLITSAEPYSLKTPQLQDFILYPNPVKDILTIQSFSAEHDNYIVTIININGKAVYQKNINNPGDIQADLSFLAKGIYLCRIICGEKVTVIKLVKN